MFIIARLCSHSTAIIPALKRELGSREVARTYVAFYLSQISEIHMEYNYRLSHIQEMHFDTRRFRRIM